MTRQDIYEKMQEILIETFELRPDQISPKALILQDLDLDSIDAVDLMVKLQQYTNKRIDPESFKAVRTIDDVVDAIYRLVQETNGAGT